VAEYLPGSDKPVNVVSTLVDESALRQQQQEEEELSSRYKLIFEHSIIGLSFYTPDGWLIHANRIMREICNFDSDDGDAFFDSNNLFDMPPFNEVLDRHHVEEFWACSQSIVPERNMHVYLEIRLHPIYNEEGKITYLAIAVRDITEEREMYLKAKENDRQIQKVKEAIQLYESELRYMMEACEMQSWRISLDRNVIEFYSGLSTVTRTFPLEQLPKVFVNQEDDFVKSLSNPAEAFSRPLFYVGKMHPVVSGKHTEQQWVQINAIPEYDEHGRLKGVFGVWRNIMSIMQKQEQLKRETERANDSGRMKSVFLANMTHEIRTPLNAIVGFSDLLQAIEDDNEKREMIRIIHNNCDMLLRLINDILVLSNVDTNAMQIMAEPVDFNSVFEDICHSLAQRVTEPGIEFQKDSPGEPLLISIDKRRIQQVITNFVTNSVKYTRQGHIRVGYRLESHPSPLTSNLYVYCEDTGTGIPEDQRQRIFERFVKLNDYIQGTGLGLSICKAIVDKCGGEIGVDSEEGKGSTFWFRIPAKSEE
jgi:signal transduction histidine kinase